MIACLLFEPFVLWQAQWLEPSLTDEALVHAQQGKVVAASGLAAAQGVNVGMSLDTARACCQDMQLVSATTASLQRAWEMVLTELYAFSDRIESPQRGLVFLDVEATTLRDLCQLYGVAAGLATTQEMAHLLALSTTPGDYQADSEKLAGLSLKLLQSLGLDERTRQRLSWLGIRELEQLQAWSKAQLQSYLPETAKMLIRYLKGPQRQDVARFKPPLTLNARYNFTDAVTEPYQIFPILDWLAERLEAQLAGKVAYQLSLSATASGLVFSGSRLSKLPLARAGMIARQARLSLQDSGVLGLGIEQLQLELTGIAHEALQLSLWQQRAQLSKAVQAVSERFAEGLFVFREVNPYMPIAEFRFRKQVLAREGEGDAKTESRCHQSGWPTHKGEHSTRIAADRQLSSVA